jgi:VWFA-related protein
VGCQPVAIVSHFDVAPHDECWFTERAKSTLRRDRWQRGWDEPRGLYNQGMRLPVLLAILVLVLVPFLSAASQEPELEESFGEEITVSIRSLTVRVVDTLGNPVLGLEPGDFRVRVGKREVPVASVDWIGVGEEAVSGSGPRDTLEAVPVEPAALPGRTMVFFVQADLNPSRIHGQLSLRHATKDFLAKLSPEDRVAVVSFDSHLKLRQDFTRDREAIHEALDWGMLFGYEKGTSEGEAISLARTFDFDEAWKAASAERGLEVTAKALKPLPGEKVVVFVGWGLGTFGSNGVKMKPAFAPAVRALKAARATVFVLDITNAESHSLEVGLEAIAASTGGAYTKTHLFPLQATDFLARATAGHYLLTLDRDALPEGGGRVVIELRGKKGTVLARPVVLR